MQSLTIKILLAILFMVVGSRIELALQQSDVTPKLCVAEQTNYVDSQVATPEQYAAAKKK